ncbi:MAG: hypothetical protein R2715_17865 [Ilumatobacteraceae bacterium]
MPDAHLDPLVHVAQPDHPDLIAEARAEAGRAIRDIGHALVGHHVPVELLGEVTSTLDRLTELLDQGRPARAIRCPPMPSSPNHRPTERRW